MGIFKSIRTGIGSKLIAKDSFNKYMAVKMTYPDMSEAEIANAIFRDCFVMNNMNIQLDSKERASASNYINSGFDCDSLLTFCLISLDVEGKISPQSGSFDSAVTTIIKELDKLGFIKEGSGSLTKDAEAFKKRWRHRIFPIL